jgi:hypothetical protein
MRPFFNPHLKNHEGKGVQIIGGARPALPEGKRPPTEAANKKPPLEPRAGDEVAVTSFQSVPTSSG